MVVRRAMEEEEIRCMSENPRFGNLPAVEKEYFSGSIVEAAGEDHRAQPGLKRSASYNEERYIYVCIIYKKYSSTTNSATYAYFLTHFDQKVHMHICMNNCLIGVYGEWGMVGARMLGWHRGRWKMR